MDTGARGFARAEAFSTSGGMKCQIAERSLKEMQSEHCVLCGFYTKCSVHDTISDFYEHMSIQKLRTVGR